MTFLVNTSFRRAALAAGAGLPRRARRVVARGGDAPGRASRPRLRRSCGSVRPVVGRAPPPRSAACRPRCGARPTAAAPRVALAGEYLQRVRETGDAAFYARAETLLRGVLARDPDNADALVALGGLALSRHDFRGGLALARRADAGLSALPVEVDALVELGRYGEARRTLQRLANLKPNLSTYARVSYLRELHGDLRGAACGAGAGRPRRAGRRRRTRRRSTSCAATWRWCAARPGEARAAYARALGRRAEVCAGGGRARAAGRASGPARDRHPPLPRARRAAAAARVRHRARRGGARGRAAARRARGPSRSCGCSSGCWRVPASTRTWSSRCSRATTAAARAGWRSRGARGRMPRASAPPTRSAGR